MTVAVTYRTEPRWLCRRDIENKTSQNNIDCFNGLHENVDKEITILNNNSNNNYKGNVTEWER